MVSRRKRGDETRDRLLDWSEATKASERLAAQILMLEGFQSVDPSHPLGGPDGLKDALCVKDGVTWVAAAYFPRGQKKNKEIEDKFSSDLAGVEKNSAQGFVFITNQYLNPTSRERLAESSRLDYVEIFHLERIASLLDQPRSYGVRLEFLDIEMSKEEQLAFFASTEEATVQLRSQLSSIIEQINRTSSLQDIPISELNNFRNTLESIVGTGFFQTGLFSPPIQKLQVPLADLREFEAILTRLAGGPFATISTFGAEPPLKRLSRLPLELTAIEERIDRIIWKLNQANELKKRL